jgi:hypothetical protein
MPQIEPGEEQEHWMERCVPMMVEEGRDQEQAVAVCMQMFRDGQKAEEAPDITTAQALKAVGDWEVEVLAVPFGGPKGGKDSHGEFFDAKSDVGLAKAVSPYVHYYHGFTPEGSPQGKPEEIGNARYSHTNEQGHWYRIVFDKAKKLARQVWEAAKQGMAFASSGSIQHLVRISANGHIDYWPVAEISVFDVAGRRQPANMYAVATPVAKAFCTKMGEPYPGDDEARGAQESAEPVVAPIKSAKGVIEMDEKELEGKITGAVGSAVKAALEAQEVDRKAKEEAEKTEKERIDAAVKAEREKWEADAAKANRLPFDIPVVAKFGDHAYDHLDAGDMALLAGVLGSAGKRVSEVAIKSLAAKLETDKTGVGEMGRQAMKMAGIKANEIDYSTSAGFGDEWVGVAYSQAIWEAIRLGTPVVAKLPTVEVPQGMESIYLPLESTDPVFYKVAEATSVESTLKIPQATVTNSPLVTARVQLTLAKIGARVLWTGEMEESSLVPFVNQLRSQLVVAGQEYLESAVIDGDTDATINTNINDIDGTPAATDWFLVFNGFRKSPLITTTANSRSAAGSLDVTDYLETVKLMGAGGKNGFDRSKVGFIVDIPTHYKTSTLPEVLTRDVFVSPTIEGGKLNGLFGYEILPSAQMCKNGGNNLSESTGKVDETTADNAYGSILAVRWDQWKFGWRRRMTIETTRIANADSTEIVAMLRCGLIQRDTEASAITYYVGV